MKKALITGITGQDGSYLAELLLAWRWFPEVAGFAALGAILGHCFPVWLKFNGGKGVATMMGVSLGLAWPVGLAYALTWRRYFCLR